MDSRLKDAHRECPFAANRLRKEHISHILYYENHDGDLLTVLKKANVSYQEHLDWYKSDTAYRHDVENRIEYHFFSKKKQKRLRQRALQRLYTVIQSELKRLKTNERISVFDVLPLIPLEIISLNELSISLKDEVTLRKFTPLNNKQC